MRIKSYFAQSVHEAMQKARCELGPEALLLSSKKATTPGTANSYEVVFGVSNETVSAPTAQLSSSEPTVAQQLSELRQQIQQMHRSFTSVPEAVKTVSASAADSTTDQLVSLGFSTAMALELSQCAQARLSKEPAAAQPASPAPRRRGRPPGARKRAELTKNLTLPPEALSDEIGERLTVAPDLNSGPKEQKIVMFVGPPGAGKTTTLVKLAVAYGTMRKLPVQILSTDTLRLGGAEQLHAYARILGVSFQAVSGRARLEQALSESQSKKLILIDTPGFAPADMDEASDLSAFAQHQASLEIQLVLPATLNSTAMLSALRRFEPFRPSKLCFTHIDEMESPGCMLEAAIRSALPLSFLANGQQIPECIAPASRAELRNMLVARLSGRGLVAA